MLTSPRLLVDHVIMNPLILAYYYNELGTIVTKFYQLYSKHTVMSYHYDSEVSTIHPIRPADLDGQSYTCLVIVFFLIVPSRAMN